MMDMLSATIFLPLFGALLIALLPSRSSVTIKGVALVISVLTLILTLLVAGSFDQVASGMQFAISLPWVPSLGINYHLGIDGISLLMMLLTAFLLVVCVLASWNSITDGIKGYFACLLVLTSGILGVFSSLDLFLFYVFWEVMLIPMYFLIGIWGGQRRVYAAIKFVLFTMAGSLLMLVAILYLAWHHHAVLGEYSFDMTRILTTDLTVTEQLWLFGAFALAFAVKVPLWPLHTWLPDAHVQAPTAGSVILAGVLLKMGTYGFIRICMPFFPDATVICAPYIATLAVIAIIYGALVSLVQKDIKSLVAFSSVSHMGFVMLGLFTFTTQGMEGAVLQMLNHGVSTGALFLLVGMIYDRRHTRMISDFGGIANVMPGYATVFMIVMLSSIGLPLTNGFVGEFLILLGTWKANNWWAFFAATGVILAACYMLWMYQRVIFGKVTSAENQHLKDLNPREWLILVPFVIFIFWIGIQPGQFLTRISPTVAGTIQHLERPMQVHGHPTRPMFTEKTGIAGDAGSSDAH